MNRILLLISLSLCSCTSDNSKVISEYKHGNPHARDLLLHGFNYHFSEHCNSEILERALRGDEEAKQILYAQMCISPSVIKKHSTTVIPMPMRIS